MFRDELEQRLQVQRQLRESDARVRAIVDSAPIVLFAIDRDGVITFSAGSAPTRSASSPARPWAGRHPISSWSTRSSSRAFARPCRELTDGRS